MIGDHDLSTAGAVTAALGQAVSSGRPVLVDLTEATFIDSTIVHALIDAHKQFNGGPARLTLRVEDGSAARRVLEVSGVSPTLTPSPPDPEAAAA